MKANERVKYLRKNILKLTQQDFSEALKISRSNMGNIEIGRIALTDRVIDTICEKFNVNKEWIIDGIGEIFIQRTRSQIITDFAADLILEEDESFKKRLVSSDFYTALPDYFQHESAQFNKVYIRYRGCCSGQGVSRDTHVYFQGCVFIPGHD